MIITRTPFRVSFCGGGSDMQSFYQEHEGCVLSTSINRYMYISIHPYFNEGQIALKYSKTEIVSNVNEIEHRIFASMLKRFGVMGVEITSTADVPAGTGLGSSSSFTVGLLHALHTYKGKQVSRQYLAEEACDIEINILGSPIGKQDQYAAAFGGLNFIRFLQNGETVVEPVLIKKEIMAKLQRNLMMMYTGEVRNANTILQEQKNNLSKQDKVKGLIKMCGLAYDLRDTLAQGNLDAFGEILNANWQLKKNLASGISNGTVNAYYDQALAHGAAGGKLLGAGGGGFLLFYCDEDKQPAVRKALGLKEMTFAFDYTGSSVIYVGDKYWD